MINEFYRKEVQIFPMDLSFLEGRSLLISGATGMIASYLIDCIMEKGINCRIIALGRSEKKAHDRFGLYFTDHRFVFYQIDIEKEIKLDERADYIIHAASNTHPVAYATDPIGTITTNVIGLKNLLDYGASHGNKRFVFLSSVEIYGENRGDIESFTEDYSGYINCNSLRAGYPESKRVGEALCQAYISQKNLDIVIARLSRVYGPTLLESDTKALSQFIFKAVKKENIVLKSSGTQLFSYLYVADAVSGIMTILSKGKNGEAYNVADNCCDITLRELAEILAEIARTEVVFEKPNTIELAGYSKATKAILNSEKLKALGWNAQFSMRAGLERTIYALRD